MNTYMRYACSLAVLCVVASSGLICSYKTVKSETAPEAVFDALAKEKKYTLVLFYQLAEKKKKGWFGSVKKTIITPESDQKALQTFKEISEHPKFKHHNEINFIAVDVEKDTFGAALFNRYSPESLPAYVLLHDGKEETNWLQRYTIPGDMSKQQLEEFLNDVLK
jgi:hypothetical protein